VRTVARDGFVPRVDVLKVLGLAPGYTMRGFGEKRSGLKKITREEFQDLLLLFNSTTR
jgi:hypothetical protein